MLAGNFSHFDNASAIEIWARLGVKKVLLSVLCFENFLLIVSRN
jgi:hypothetical protein